MVYYRRPPPLGPGQVFAGKYHVVSAIGEGAVGQVWEVESLLSGERQALKTLLPKNLDKPHLVHRFAREITALRTLQHPNIVAYVDHGRDEYGRPFLVTEIVRGFPASEFIGREPPLRLSQVSRVLKQVCSAVELAHRYGVIHRDLKWDNVMVTSRRYGSIPIKLIDFGILAFTSASRLSDGRKLTDTAVIVGTPEYASPEQLLKHRLDQRSDVYALGVMTYEMLTWQKPFRGENAMATILKQVNSEPLRVDLLPGPYPLTREVGDVIERALRKQPDHRWGTVDAFYRNLDLALKTVPT